RLRVPGSISRTWALLCSANPPAAHARQLTTAATPANPKNSRLVFIASLASTSYQTHSPAQNAVPLPTKPARPQNTPAWLARTPVGNPSSSAGIPLLQRPANTSTRAAKSPALPKYPAIATAPVYSALRSRRLHPAPTLESNSTSSTFRPLAPVQPTN